MKNYYILNKETGKLELHFEKETYQALTDAQKKEMKSNFLWGRNSGCWISRAKWPNTHWAERCAVSMGLENAGEMGERMTFAEQMERKAERAERRADRYENRADAHATSADHLRKPILDMHGDIAFFTQPNMNTAGGRAFTRRREKMFASFERGFDEFRKSEYWQERAAAARRTAEQSELKDRAFLDRRIRERESDIRKLKKRIEECESAIASTPQDHSEKLEQEKKNLDSWLDRLEVKLDELGFYQDCLEAVGGIAFSRDNVKVGFTVKVPIYGVGKVVGTGPKNFKFLKDNFLLSMQYAKIIEIVNAQEPKPSKTEEKALSLAEFAAQYAEG